MAQLDRHERLAQEAALHLLVGGDLGAHHLHDADLVQQTVAELVDRPHAAFLRRLEDLVLLVEREGLAARGVGGHPAAGTKKNSPRSWPAKRIGAYSGTC